MQKLLITILLIIFSLQNAHANIIRDSEIEETIFENRFKHLQELKNMGANIHMINNHMISPHHTNMLNPYENQ